MFPIRDHNPSEQTAYVTLALIILNIVLFVVTMPWGANLGGLWNELALYPVAVLHGENMWGLVTHMFLHAGFLHIIGNLLFLWIFGDNLEEQMGHLGFLVFYFACGLLAAGAQILADPQSGVPMVGASGAIAGVMGAYLLMFPRAKVDVVAIIIVFIKVFTVPAWVLLGLWFFFQIFGGFVMVGSETGVAYLAHAGGFVAGLILGVPVFLRRGGSRFWSQTHGQPPHPPTQYAAWTQVPQVPRR